MGAQCPTVVVIEKRERGEGRKKRPKDMKMVSKPLLEAGALSSVAHEEPGS